MGGLTCIKKSSEYEDLSQKHSKKKESISKFLLSLSGFKDTNLKVKKNQKNDLISFSYRNYNDWILVDEIKIISKNSPIHSDNNKTKTAEQSSFKLVLTNKDDSDKEKNTEKTNSKILFEAQVNIIDSLIEELNLNVKSNNLIESEEALENKIKNLTSKRSGISSEINTLTNKRKNLWVSVQETESQILSTKELLNRFILLKEQYESDKQRLIFLLEGEHYFSLLNFEKCPTCNQAILLNEQPACNHLDIQQKKESYTKELEKILLHIEDLNNTIDDMENELKSLRHILIVKNEEYQTLGEILDMQLEPQNHMIEEEINNLLIMQKSIDEDIQRKQTLKTMQEEKEKIVNSIEKDIVEDSNTEIDYSQYYNQLCDNIKYYLKGWKYPGANNVEFDNKQKDILISGKARRLFGKGLRSLSYSAFVLGVMRYCNSKNLPHPGLVVLDSPVTSYKEEDSEEDKISEDLQDRFFEFLADDEPNNQIIILENKRPSQKVIEKINFIEFTKNYNYGRYGFIKTRNDSPLKK